MVYDGSPSTGDAVKRATEFLSWTNSTAARPLSSSLAREPLLPWTGIPSGNGSSHHTTELQDHQVPSEIPETGTIKKRLDRRSITAPLGDLEARNRRYVVSVTALTFAYTSANPILADGDATRPALPLKDGVA